MKTVTVKHKSGIPFIREYILIIILLIGLGIIKNQKTVKAEHIQLKDVAGVLFGFPVDATSTNNRYIGLTLKGDNNFYQFVGDSYMPDRLSDYQKLSDGDSLYLRVKSTPYLTTRLADGSSISNIQICEAFSPDYGYLIKLDEYNNSNKPNRFLKITGYILFLIGVIGLIFRLYIWNQVFRHSKK